MEYKDYYKILGIDKNANADEIKTKFRKLALKYHPDKTKGDKIAEEKFKEVNEAYEVLSNPEKRKKYNELGENWKYYQQAGGEAQGFDWSKYAQSQGGTGGGKTYYHFEGDPNEVFGGSGFSDFFDAIFGQASRQGGSGRKRRTTAFKGQDFTAEMNITLDDAYRGGARVFKLDGQSIKLKIKPGIKSGQVLKLTGKGAPGMNGGPAGDLLLTINVMTNSKYERKGNDLYTDLNVDLYTTILGGKKEFRTLKGSIKLNIPKGTPNGKVLKLPKMGMPKYNKPKEYGDLYVKLNVQLPEDLKEKELSLFKELQSLRN
ncbi:MAG: J domain-containing protein [Ignavibacteria bacterium]|nr:J domain-containing protein [Ignavibacteria bacterium]